MFLLAWYCGAARQQALLVKTRYGARYHRKTWDSMLLDAVMAGAAYFSVSALLAVLLAAIT